MHQREETDPVLQDKQIVLAWAFTSQQQPNKGIVKSVIRTYQLVGLIIIFHFHTPEMGKQVKPGSVREGQKTRFQLALTLAQLQTMLHRPF